MTKKLKKLVFHTVGDTGGIKNEDYQDAVAAQMKADLNLPEAARPQFFYHLGDVVYYNGEVGDYYDQFYSPYDHYGPPVIAIPGNHDGDPKDAGQQSLDGWVRYFMIPQPHIDREIAGDAPRVTLSLPNVYFTLECPFVTIIGMYTNVPEGGSIDSVQQQWLTNEFATAPGDKALILALHHPIYSFDDHHNGSAAMADAVQHAINYSRRVPNLVLTAHVHNYQRIEREIVKGTATPFLVAGHGGYYHLHGMTAEAGHVDGEVGAKLVFHDQFHHGYVTISVDGSEITGKMTRIAQTGSAKHKRDAQEDLSARTFLDLAFGRIRLLLFFHTLGFIKLLQEAGIRAELLSRKETNRLRTTKGLRTSDLPPLYEGCAIGYYLKDTLCYVGSMRFHEMAFNWVSPHSLVAQMADAISTAPDIPKHDSKTWTEGREPTL